VNGYDLRSEAHVRILTEDVVQSSDIEGEKLDSDQVRSSIAKRLSVDPGLFPADRYVEGVVEMMLDATGNCAAPLTRERLFAWYASLFPTGYSGLGKIRTGTGRDDASGPMQWFPARSASKRSTTKHPAVHLPAEIASLTAPARSAGSHRPASNRGSCSPLVCHHPPVRRRERAYRACRSRYGAGSRGKQRPACVFREHSATHSTPIRPPMPEAFGH
jgi:hypothetical protein